MAESDPSSLSGLPQWPAEAKEVPGGEAVKESFRWVYRAGAIGAGLGLLRALPILPHLRDADAFQLGQVTGSVLFVGLLGMAVGYLIDRRRWVQERRQRERGID
jgi:hypothetical protein